MSSESQVQPELTVSEMTLLEHLDELRKRLVVTTVAVMVTTVFCFLFAQQIVEILAQPIGGIEVLKSIE